MTSSNLNDGVVKSLKCLDDVIIPLKNTTNPDNVNWKYH